MLRGGKTRVAILSLIIIITISICAVSVSAGTHTSTATVTPGIVAGGENDKSFDVKVCNTGSVSDDPIHEFRIYYQYGQFIDFSDVKCASKAGWNGPIILPTIWGNACWYSAITASDEIKPGTCTDFEFTADTPKTQCCRVLRFETRDVDDYWRFVDTDICVDTTKPETTKTFDGPQKIENKVEWIDGVTKIVLTPTDPDPHPSGVKETKYRLTLLENNEACKYSEVCQSSNTVGNDNLGGWQTYSLPFPIPQESCHLLEYYSVDKVGNVEDVNKNCFFVDKTPPEVSKVVGDPKKPMGEEFQTIGAGTAEWTNLEKHFGDYSAKLYVPDGEEDIAAVEFDVDIPLNEITTLSFWQKISNTYGINVILGIDADGDGVYESQDKLWHIGLTQHDATVLGDDTFIEMDGISPSSGNWEEVDAYNTKQWWTTNAIGNGLSSDCYQTLGNFFSCSDMKPNLGSTDHVKVIRLLIGGSGSWMEKVAYVDDITLNENKIELEPHSWFVSSDTKITFTCRDPEPHPSEGEELCFKVSYDKKPEDLTGQYCIKYGGALKEGFCCKAVNEKKEFIFDFDEESFHDLEYYCKDAVGKKSEAYIQYYKVITPPIIEKEMLGSDHIEDCPPAPKPSDDVCYVKDGDKNGVRITATEEDGTACPSGTVECRYELWWTKPTGEKIIVNSGPFDGGEGKEIYFTEDSTHTLKTWCKYALGESYDEEEFLVDSTPPVTTKTYGTPFFSKNGVEWITSQTPITLSATDEKVGQVYPNAIYWRNTLVPDEMCNNKNLCGCNSPQQEVFDLTGNVEGTVTKVDNGDSYTWTISIASENPAGHTWGVGMAFATSLNEPDFQVWYREYQEPYGWYYQDYETGWNGEVVPLPTGITATGDHIGKVFTITIPKSKLGDEKCKNFYWGAQARTNLLGKYPSTWAQWSGGSGEVSGMAVSNTGGISGNWNLYKEPFYKGEESCHLIEYYSVDKLGNEEQVKSQCVFVDNTAPTPDKNIEEPYTEWIPTTDPLDDDATHFYSWIVGECGDSIDCWKVTLDTKISMECEDPTPHPVGNEKVCFKVELDGEDVTSGQSCGPGKCGYEPGYCDYYHGEYNKTTGYCCVRSEIENFKFLEESEHNLQYYCVDALGNGGPESNNWVIDEEKFKVLGKMFQIRINDKWNLISVPFVLLNDDPAEVFDDLKGLQTVWSYDENGEWHVYRPEGDGTNDLENIVPGEGYWLLADCEDMNCGPLEDFCQMLTLGGSLYQAGPVAPPSKNLSKGWNLIGYYGTEGRYAYRGPDPFFPYITDSKKSYCALYSLRNLGGGILNPTKWSAVVGYWEPDNPNQWEEYGFCNKMDPGAGYWVSMDAEGDYKPETTCNMNILQQFMCSVTE